MHPVFFFKYKLNNDNFSFDHYLIFPPFLFQDNTFQKMFYNYTVPPQMLLSFFVMLANLTILCCIHWIQRPLSSILVLSLSLAMADVCTTLGYTLSLFINSFLRVVYEVEYPILGQIVDSLRQSGAIMTVLHLLTLSLYHYLGILKPLQYHSARATKKIILVITVLWIGPLILVCVIFEHVLDLEWLENRITFASLFFVPLLFMCFFYARILCILQRQQKIWAQLSRNGSSRWKPLKSKTSGEKNQHQRHVEGNIRAVKTTLYILGSCVIGWTPAALIMVFKDYVSKTDNEVFFPIFFVKNILLILKSLANPIIYTIRMTEIQVSLPTKELKRTLVLK